MRWMQPSWVSPLQTLVTLASPSPMRPVSSARRTRTYWPTLCAPSELMMAMSRRMWPSIGSAETTVIGMRKLLRDAVGVMADGPGRQREAYGLVSLKLAWSVPPEVTSNSSVDFVLYRSGTSFLCGQPPRGGRVS